MPIPSTFTIDILESFAIVSKHECRFLTSLPVGLLHLDTWRRHGGFVRGTYLSVLPLFRSHSVPAGIESPYPKNVQVSSHQWWLSHLVIFESCNGTNHAGVPIRPQLRLVQALKKSSYLSIFSPISKLTMLSDFQHVHCNGTAFTIAAMFFLCAYKYEVGLGGDPSLGTSSVLFSSLPPISRTELLNEALLKSLRVDTFWRWVHFPCW